MPRGRLSLIFALVAMLVVVFGSSTSAHADPDLDDEGGSLTLRQKLEEASIGYYESRALLTASQQRQVEITAKLRVAELSLARLSAEVSVIASGRYKGAQLGVLNGLFTGEGDPAQLLTGAALNEYLVWRDDTQLREYRTARDEAATQQALLDAEVSIQAKALAQLDAQKREAEKALASVGGMASVGYNGPVPEAQPAVRNADGSWPRESCSIKDPTSGGCLSPRMYHALNEARLAGFTKYVHCWRTQSWGEHPKGRACDFSVQDSGFGGTAVGAEKDYGTRLATWSKENAPALGVLYVIWFRQIWTPSTGWRTYSGSGDPSSAHTNHVHLSML